MEIANDTLYGLGAGVGRSDLNHAHKFQARHPGGTGVDQLLPSVSGAAFGGYKQSGIGRETHKMMLDRTDEERARQLQPERHGIFSRWR